MSPSVGFWLQHFIFCYSTRDPQEDIPRIKPSVPISLAQGSLAELDYNPVPSRGGGEGHPKQTWRREAGREQSALSRAQCLLPQGRWPGTEISWVTRAEGTENTPYSHLLLVREQEPRLEPGVAETENGAVRWGEGEQRRLSGWLPGSLGPQWDCLRPQGRGQPEGMAECLGRRGPGKRSPGTEGGSSGTRPRTSGTCAQGPRRLTGPGCLRPRPGPASLSPWRP